MLTEIFIQSIKSKLFANNVKKIEIITFSISLERDELIKEKLILNLGFAFLYLTSMVASLLFLLLGFLFIIPKVFNINLEYLLLLASISSIAYLVARHVIFGKYLIKNSRLTQLSSNRYDILSRWLHWFALDLRFLRRASFEIEKALFLKKAALHPRLNDAPVFVMGLPRSGTTIVLEILNASGAFCSAKYSDMPFVLSPNLWRSASGRFRTASKKVDRAHGDGMQISSDSSESFEEVFWRTSCDDEASARGIADLTEEHIKDFLDYQKLTVYSGIVSDHSEGSLRYLSKNNNNLDRFQRLALLDHTKIVLVIRDPLETATSLLRQHLSFLKSQEDDPFIKHYMRWLGHNEFGHLHKPLEIGRSHLNQHSPMCISYWLAYWLGVHEALLGYYMALPEATKKKVLALEYESLCSEPMREISRLMEALDVNNLDVANFPTVKKSVSGAALLSEHDRHLYDRAFEVYKKLVKVLQNER